VDWGTGSLNLKYASEIVAGKTAKFSDERDSANVKFKNVDPRLCFSILCPDRSLDLHAQTEQQRDLWVKGLRDLKLFLNPNLINQELIQ